MKIQKAFRSVLSVLLAALAGNWVGAQLRYLATGQTTSVLYTKYTNERGQTFSNAPVTTNFYPALLFARVGKPRWLFAFLGGALVTALIGDRFERYWLEWLAEQITSPSSQETVQGEHAKG